MAARLLIPGLSTLAMLATLLFLGTWQVERLAWKRGLLEEIAAAERQPAEPLGSDPRPFAKVRVEGVIDPQLIAIYGAEVRTVNGASAGGAQLLGVLRREGQPAILVLRGWVPVPMPPVATGAAVIDGYVRGPDAPGMFTPADDVGGHRFYTLDPLAIGRALGVESIAPFTLVALGTAPAGGYPDPARSLPRPNNNHLAYAATWYGLSAILLVIFSLHVRKVLRA